MSTGERAVVAAALVVVAALLGLGAPTPWTGVGFLLVFGLFYLAGRACPAPDLDATAAVVVRTALGLALAIVCWSLSAYVVEGLWLGSLALLMLATAGFVGVLRARRGEPHPVVVADDVPRGVLPAVLTAALALGVYVVGANEIVRGEEMFYTFRWDWDVHLFWASLVREQGLPLVGTAGSPEAPLERLMHTGLLCSVAGIEQLTRTTPYQAARMLAIGCFALLALAGLVFVRATRLPRTLLVLAALSPLVWGSASLPFDLAAAGFHGLRDPYASGAYPATTAGGALYHNLTQLESVALAAAALAAIPGARGGSWTLAAVLTGVAGLVKPTTAAVVGPALLGLALWHRASVPVLLRMAAVFAAAVVLLALPVLVAEPPAGVPAVLDPRGLASLFSLRTVVWLGLSGACAIAWLARGRRDADGTRTALALSCLVGCVLAAVWREPTKSSDINESWGLNAALVLMAPHVVAFALAPRALAVRVCAALLLALHIASGALYAGHYPRLVKRGLWLPTRALLERVRASTRPGTRLFVDMRLLPATGYASLGRPTPFPLHLAQPAERYDAATWRGLMNRQDLPPQLPTFLARRDAVVLGPWTRALRPVLEANGWRLVWTDEVAEGELWVRRDASAGY